MSLQLSWSCQSVGTSPKSQINLLEVLTDDVLATAAWFATRSVLVCRWLVELVDDSGGADIRSSQDITVLASKLLSDGVEDA